MGEKSRIELLSGAELAKRLGCTRKRVYYLSKTGKLGYLSVTRSNGRKVYIYDRPFRAVESVKKRIDFADIEKDINYLVLSAQDLRHRFLALSKQFLNEEQKILDHRLKV